MNINFVQQALSALYPSNKFRIPYTGSAFVFSDIICEGTPPSIDEDAVTSKVTELQAAEDAQAYARARKPLYPAIGDQLDDLYHAGVFSADMTAKLKKVKDDNPK